MLASSAPFGNKIPFPYLWKDNQTQVRTLKDENIVPVRDYGLDGAIPTSKNEPETNIIALRDISELATIGHFSAVVQFKENIEGL